MIKYLSENMKKVGYLINLLDLKKTVKTDVRLESTDCSISQLT